MNLLYLKESKFKITLLYIFTLFYSLISTCQEKDNFDVLIEKSDAYYLYNQKDIKYKRHWSRNNKYVTITNKLVVNSINGVKNHAFLNLSEHESNHLMKIEVETLKADGTIIKLDSSLVFQKPDKRKRFSAIKYPIPAVEPGDTIFTSYTLLERKKQKTSSYASLHNNLPIKKSIYSITTDRNLTFRYKTYNGFPKPKVISNDTLLRLEFSMDKLKPIQENQYSCFQCELPYLYYALDKYKAKLRTWKNVYNEEFNALTQPLNIDYEHATYYKRWKRRTIGEAKDSSKIYKFKLLYNAILNNFNITELIPEEAAKSNGYFLKEGKFDPISIGRFYRQILEDLDINYWAVFAKSKRNGAIDYSFIRKKEFDHVFFALEEENGTIDFLYPHNEFFKYQINEIPTSIYNTSAVLVKPIQTEKKNKFITRNLQLAKVDSVSVSKIILPGMNSLYNTVNQIVFCKVDLENKTINHKSSYRISGGLSTEIRTFLNTLNENNELTDYYEALDEYEGEKNAIQIDSVINRKFNSKKPFTFSINSKGKINNILNFINDSLVSFSIDKIINHNAIETIPLNSDLSYYLDYTFTDNFRFMIEFPKKIEVLGINNSNIELINEYGNYIFKIKKLQDNTIMVSSSYKIKKNKIPKESYNQLKKLNDGINEVKNKKFIIKIKP